MARVQTALVLLQSVLNKSTNELHYARKLKTKINSKQKMILLCVCKNVEKESSYTEVVEVLIFTNTLENNFN